MNNSYNLFTTRNFSVQKILYAVKLMFIYNASKALFPYIPINTYVYVNMRETARMPRNEARVSCTCDIFHFSSSIKSHTCMRGDGWTAERKYKSNTKLLHHEVPFFFFFFLYAWVWSVGLIFVIFLMFLELREKLEFKIISRSKITILMRRKKIRSTVRNWAFTLNNLNIFMGWELNFVYVW